MNRPTAEQGRLPIVGHTPSFSREPQRLSLPPAVHPAFWSWLRRGAMPGYRQRKLDERRLASGRQPVHRLTQGETEVQETPPVLRQGKGKLYLLGPAGRDVQTGQRSPRGRLTVPCDLPVSLEISEGPEIQAVRHCDPALLQAHRPDPDRLPYRFCLQQAGGGAAVGQYQAIHTEVAVVAAFPEIPAIQVAGGPIRRHPFLHGVITPFPYKPAGKVGVSLQRVPVIPDIAGAVPHGMAEFAQHQGAGIPPALAIVPAPADFRIHAAGHVGAGLRVARISADVGRPLIVHRPGIVPFMDPAQRLFKIAAPAAFVAHGPHHHAGTVFVPFHQGNLPLEEQLPPGRIVGQPVKALFIASEPRHGHAVAFEIRLVDDIKTQTVAHLVKTRIVRIVGGADGVDMMCLH